MMPKTRLLDIEDQEAYMLFLFKSCLEGGSGTEKYITIALVSPFSCIHQIIEVLKVVGKSKSWILKSQALRSGILLVLFSLQAIYSGRLLVIVLTLVSMGSQN